MKMSNAVNLACLSRYKTLFNAIPIGDKKVLPLAEERAKMRIVAFIIGRNRGISEDIVLSTMCNIRDLDITKIPNLMQALQTLHIRQDYIMDYNKIQMLYEQGAIMTFENFLCTF